MVNNLPGPDLNAALLQLDQQMRSGNGKPSFVLGILPNAEVGSGISLRSSGGFDKPICYLAQSFKNRRAQGSALENALSGMLEQFRKMASDANVMYAGEVTTGTSVQSNMPMSDGMSGGMGIA